MASRAFSAENRPDGTYNLHYPPWGGQHLRVKQAITARTTVSAAQPSQWSHVAYDHRFSVTT
jgi:hypothetical protein